MSVRFFCQFCGKPQKASNRQVGRKVKCRQCEQELVVPDLSPVPPESATTGLPSGSCAVPKTRQIQKGSGVLRLALLWLAVIALCPVFVWKIVSPETFLSFDAFVTPSVESLHDSDVAPDDDSSNFPSDDTADSLAMTVPTPERESEVDMSTESLPEDDSSTVARGIINAETEMLERIQFVSNTFPADLLTSELAKIADQFTNEHPNNYLIWMQATLVYAKAVQPNKTLTCMQEFERLLADLPDSMRPPTETMGQFWSRVAFAHLDAGNPNAALDCLKKAANIDASYEAIAKQFMDYLENISPSIEALAKAKQIDDVTPDFEASRALRLGREGVLVLTEPKYEEIRGKVLGVSASGSVALLHTRSDTHETNLLVFPRGTIAQIFNGNEVEISRYHQIMPAGYDAYPVFRDFGSVCSLRFETSTSKFVGRHTRLAPYKGGRDQLIQNGELTVSEVVKYWESLDQKRSSLNVPYTWTREFAHACREHGVKTSTEVVYNVFEYSAMRKKGVARFLNLPVDGPYSKYEVTEMDMFGEGLFDGLTLLSPKQFAKLTPEEQQNAIASLGKTVRFVNWVRDLDKQQSNASFSHGNLVSQSTRSEQLSSKSGQLSSKTGQNHPEGRQVKVTVQWSDGSRYSNKRLTWERGGPLWWNGLFHSTTNGSGVAMISLPHYDSTVRFYFDGVKKTHQMTVKSHEREIVVPIPPSKF